MRGYGAASWPYSGQRDGANPQTRNTTSKSSLGFKEGLLEWEYGHGTRRMRGILENPVQPRKSSPPMRLNRIGDCHPIRHLITVLPCPPQSATSLPPYGNTADTLGICPPRTAPLSGTRGGRGWRVAPDLPAILRALRSLVGCVATTRRPARRPRGLSRD